jgi:hypothetical protein
MREVDIPNTGGAYAVREDGRIISRMWGKVRVLGSRISPNGYLICRPKIRGVFKTLTVHRLVAEAFCPNPNGLPEVNHRDGDKQNSHPDNLEWVTGSDNIKHSFYILRRQPAQQKLTQAHVQTIRALLPILSNMRLAKQFQVSRSLISQIRTGKIWCGSQEA